jgi:inosine/xanthosine triphosphate pyrophosphatase family protein
VLCRPVLCDDSGFCIPSRGGWPGSRVARVLRRTQPDGTVVEDLEPFLEVARHGAVPAYFEMVLAYNDTTLQEPKLFPSRVHGTLIGEPRGDWDNPPVSMKSRLWYVFIPQGQEKTIAEMSDEERLEVLKDYWTDIRAYLGRR